MKVIPMPLKKNGRIFWLGLIFFAFAFAYLFTVQHYGSVLAADDEQLWVDEDWNILTLVPEGWDWIEDYADDVPVVFIPESENNRGVSGFIIFVTYLGKQTGEDIKKLKDEYVKALEADLKDFRLNSVERTTTNEGLTAYDMSYTFTEDGRDALGYDRLLATEEDIYWATSFSAGKKNFKAHKGDAMSIIDSFVFDASAWLEEKQEKD